MDDLAKAPQSFLPSDVLRIQQTLSYLEERFRHPVWEDLEVSLFSGPVAVLDDQHPFFYEWADDIHFVRCLVGRHSSQSLTVSI